MPMVYTISLATAGNSACSGTPNTEVETFFVKAAARSVLLQSIYVIGKGAGLTAISGIVFRLIKWGTAATAGTTLASPAKDPGMQASLFTSGSAPTAGTTRTNHVIFGCGAAGPGGWVAPNPDSGLVLQGSGAPSIDMLNASGTASLNYEWSGEVQE